MGDRASAPGGELLVLVEGGRGMSVKHVAGQLDARMAGREGHRSGVGSRYARVCVNEQIPKLVLPTARVFTAAEAGRAATGTGTQGRGIVMLHRLMLHRHSRPVSTENHLRKLTAANPVPRESHSSINI